MFSITCVYIQPTTIPYDQKVLASKRVIISVKLISYTKIIIETATYSKRISYINFLLADLQGEETSTLKSRPRDKTHQMDLFDHGLKPARH